MAAVRHLGIVLPPYETTHEVYVAGPAACQISCQCDTQIWRYSYLNFSHFWHEMPIQVPQNGGLGDFGSLNVIIHPTPTSTERTSCKRSCQHLLLPSPSSTPTTALPQSTLTTLVTSLIHQRLDYCNYRHHPSDHYDKCKMLQPVTPALQQLHWLSVQYRIQHNIATWMHHIYNNTAPTYLCDFSQFFIDTIAQINYEQSRCCATYVHETG